MIYQIYENIKLDVRVSKTKLIPEIILSRNNEISKSQKHYIQIVYLFCKSNNNLNDEVRSCYYIVLVKDIYTQYYNRCVSQMKSIKLLCLY